MIIVAVVVPLVWLAWLVVTEWVPMFPLNDLMAAGVRERAGLAAINYPVPLLVAAGVGIHRTWSLLIACGLAVLVLAGHLVSWWLPYVGISSRAMRDAYQREYARTWKLLPTEGHDVVIDVQHMVVGALTLVMITTTVLATVRA